MKRLILALIIGVWWIGVGWCDTHVNQDAINWSGNWQNTSIVNTLSASTKLGVTNTADRNSTAWNGNGLENKGVILFLNSNAVNNLTIKLQENVTGTWTNRGNAYFNVTSGTLNATYYYFTYNTTHTESAGTANYRVNINATTANAVNFRTNNADNTSIGIIQVLNNTGALSAGDVTYVLGNASNVSINPVNGTVTVDINSTTDFGECVIGNGGVLSWRTDNNTITELDLAGNVSLFNGGILQNGHPSSKIPNASISWLKFNPASNNQFGIQKRGGGQIYFQGVGKTYYKSTLNNNVTGGTVKNITVNDTVDWRVGDLLYLCFSQGSLANSADELANITGISGTNIYFDTNGDGTGTGIALGNHSQGGIVAPLTYPARMGSKSSYTTGIFRVSHDLYNTTTTTECNISGAYLNLFRWHNGVEWLGWSAKLNEIGYNNGGYIGLNYNYWYGNFSLSKIVQYNGDTTPQVFGYYSFSGSRIDFDHCIFGYVNAGGNSYILNQAADTNITDCDFISRYTPGGDNYGLYVVNGSYLNLVNVTYSNNGGVTYGAIFNNNRFNANFYNVTFGKYGGRANTLFRALSNSKIVGTGVSVPSGWTYSSIDSVNSTTYQPYARFNNFGGVSGRHKSHGVFGDISDPFTGGKSAGWAKSNDTCVYFSPSSTTAGQTLNWEFKVPVTASTNPQLSFYTNTTGTTNGATASIDVYDNSDDNTLLVDNQSITLGSSWSQFNVSAFTPTNTGYVRCVIKVLDGSTTGDVGFDDFQIVKGGVNLTDGVDYWTDGLPQLWMQGGGGGNGTTTIINSASNHGSFN